MYIVFGEGVRFFLRNNEESRLCGGIFYPTAGQIRSKFVFQKFFAFQTLDILG